MKDRIIRWPLYSETKGREAAHQLIMGQKLQNGPSMCNASKGRKVAHHCVERPISGIWYNCII